jgi:hypothetical protein
LGILWSPWPGHSLRPQFSSVCISHRLIRSAFKMRTQWSPRISRLALKAASWAVKSEFWWLFWEFPTRTAVLPSVLRLFPWVGTHSKRV